MSRALLYIYMCALVACGRSAPTPSTTGHPRLVVLVVIDQLSEDAFEPRAAAATDGVARLMKDGRRFLATYPYAATSTAPGHAALGTGAPPAVTGIISNEIWDRELAVVVDTTKGAKGPPTAARLRVDGIADALLRAHPDAHAVAVAIKSRSALYTLGHSGVSVWYDADHLQMVSNTPRAWLDWLALLHPLAPTMHDLWRATDPARLATLSGSPDDAPGELSLRGWTSTFPHAIGAGTQPHRAFESTPQADVAITDAALAAIAAEHLGEDEIPDLLVVSFSAHDYVGHAFGPDSWESWDEWLRLDVQLGRIERALDAAAPGAWTMIMTSDHGAPSTPEHRKALGLPGLRMSYEDVADAAERGAESVAGPGPWIAAARYPSVWLTGTARALPPSVRDQLIDAAIKAIGSTPGIARAARTSELAGSCDTRTGDDRGLCLSIDPERSGEIVFLPAEGTIMAKRGDPDATDHGSLFDYDREVPLIVMGAGVTPSVVSGSVSPLAVAPTLAALLGVPPPSAARERPLPLI
ncbi:MAG TPA: alkaline phosphatase family protein [Kofleriaceae bacterium]|nr:alkaline phosphatase family protein [Kofleriaceae bacterium]